MSIRFLVIFLCTTYIFSQEKFEKEYRLDVNLVPKKALSLIKQLNFKKKVKWYAEESQDGKTIEAKGCLNKNKYSVEFTEKGNLIDVEKTIKFKKLPLQIRENIKKVLSERFPKYKIKKTQIQYKGTKEEVFKAIEKSEVKNKNFEVIVKGKSNNEYQLYELLINADGEILKELKFKSSNSLNLEF